MKCTEFVIQDHVILRRGLGILDKMADRLEEGERIEIADVKTLLKFLRVFGDEYHQTMEEKVLFPALQPAAAQEPPFCQMLLEHGKERELVAGMEDALGSKRAIAFVRGTRQLNQLLWDHFDKEDTILRELGEQALSKEVDDRVWAECVKNHKAETYENFSRLESRYAPKRQGNPLTTWQVLERPRASATYR